MDEVVAVVVTMAVKVMAVKVGKAKVGKAKAGLVEVQVVMGKAKTLTQDEEVAWSNYF